VLLLNNLVRREPTNLCQHKQHVLQLTLDILSLTQGHPIKYLVVLVHISHYLGSPVVWQQTLDIMCLTLLLQIRLPVQLEHINHIQAKQIALMQTPVIMSILQPPFHRETAQWEPINQHLGSPPVSMHNRVITSTQLPHPTNSLALQELISP
jgi:hypothetical protein